MHNLMLSLENNTRSIDTISWPELATHCYPLYMAAPLLCISFSGCCSGIETILYFPVDVRIYSVDLLGPHLHDPYKYPRFPFATILSFTRIFYSIFTSNSSPYLL